ncbi:Transcriptional regulator, HxlR family [Klebsiella pneumoniae ISC21]|nr:Transcriptional regulator, HxlR family [Klebsiella pneumoniae ISC21]
MKNEPLCRAPCPIARSLGRIGDSWSIMILRDAFAGFTRFDEFQKSSKRRAQYSVAPPEGTGR